MTSVIEFIRTQTVDMSMKLGASMSHAERAAAEAVNHYRTAHVIKGGVSAMIERHAKRAAKASKNDSA